MAEEEPKIIIDSDWKAEAQKEKERLVEEEETRAPEADLDGQAVPPLFELVNMLAMQAAVAIGGVKTPDGRVIPPDRGAAQHWINMLEVLDEKTAGNLDENEKQVLSTTLHELRMAFVASAGQPPADAPPTPEQGV